MQVKCVPTEWIKENYSTLKSHSSTQEPYDHPYVYMHSILFVLLFYYPENNTLGQYLIELSNFITS